MTERAAVRQGLNFTGHYSSRDIDKIKETAARVRKEYKCRIVMVSTSGNRGMSLYADEAYFIKERIAAYETGLVRAEEKRAMLKAKFEKDMAALEEDVVRMKGYIALNS